jgi:hypothetical protein
MPETLLSPHHLYLSAPQPKTPFAPLDRVTVVADRGTTVAAFDGAGQEYFRAPAAGAVTLQIGGAAGTQTVNLLDEKGKAIDAIEFRVVAATKIEDEGGEFADLLDILKNTMELYKPGHGVGARTWRGKKYTYFIHWILDHEHTAKGMQFFSDATPGLVEILAELQREDGMIWSFVNDRKNGEAEFFLTRDRNRGFYTRQDDEIFYVRQPTENHCEYNFVETLHMAWKGGGDDRWMEKRLDSAKRALDYSITDRERFSTKFQLLKRVYCIDSWDFQVKDEYTPDLGFGSEMIIDADRSTFGVFFGDNHGDARACDCLAEMLDHAGRGEEAQVYRQRAGDIRARLDVLVWNGKFFRHRLEEDPTIKRNLGVDEASQLNMSNAYALNRNIAHDQAVSILRQYQDLQKHLPTGSPGEWYAIYPPFRRGFEHGGAIWQYMNGGVHGHAAGELARGAFAHGFEQYGADILRRLLDLGRKHGRMVRFAYTGAFDPPPPAQQFTPIDISAHANMDLRGEGGEGALGWMDAETGNDLRNMPVGDQTFAGAPYAIVDPAGNGRRSAIGVSQREGFAKSVRLPIGKKAGAIRLVHTANRVGPSNVGGLLTFIYDDGTRHPQYMVQGTHFTGWWFPHFTTKTAGVAWSGPNDKSTSVGPSWVELVNPHPEKTIAAIEFAGTDEGATYAVLAVTLADRPIYEAPDAVSFGGPDQWAGGCCTLALIEGLAGIADTPPSTAFRRVTLSPRWSAAGIDAVRATVHYPASDGYVAYDYHHDPAKKTIDLTVTGSGEQISLRLLLPAAAQRIVAATINGVAASAAVEHVESSRYATLALAGPGPVTVRMTYA